MTPAPRSVARAAALALLALVAVAGCRESPRPRTPLEAREPASAPPEPAAPGVEAPDRAETPDAEFRQRPPPEGREGAFMIPLAHEARLANGMRVLFVESHAAPVLSIHLVSDRGSEQASEGVGAFAGAMLLMGTSTRSAIEISNALEALGATYGAGVDLDTAGLTATILSRDAEPALALFADILRNATYPEEELERVRKRRITAVAEEQDSPRALLWNAAYEALYPPHHPYSRPPLGGEAALRKITRRELVAFHRDHLEPDCVTLVVAGDISKAALLAAAESSFGTWKGRCKRALTPESPPPPGGRARVVIVDRPGAPQTNLLVTEPGAERGSKDYDALLVLSSILSRRLNGNLREEHGFTYGVSSSFAFHRGRGPFSAGGAIARDSTAEALREIFAEIERIRRGVSPGEIEAARSILGALSARFETAPATAAAVAQIAIFGLPTEEFMTKRVRLQMVDAAAVRRVAAAYLHPDRMRVVLVGDAAVIEPKLRAMDLGKIEVRRPPPARPREPEPPAVDAPE